MVCSYFSVHQGTWCWRHPAQHVQGSWKPSDCNAVWMSLQTFVIAHLVWRKVFYSKAGDELPRQLWMLKPNINSPKCWRFQFNQMAEDSQGSGRWCLHLVAKAQRCRFRSEQLSHPCWKAAWIQVLPKTTRIPASPCGDHQDVSKETKANYQLHTQSQSPQLPLG